MRRLWLGSFTKNNSAAPIHCPEPPVQHDLKMAPAVRENPPDVQHIETADMEITGKLLVPASIECPNETQLPSSSDLVGEKSDGPTKSWLNLQKKKKPPPSGDPKTTHTSLTEQRDLGRNPCLPPRPEDISKLSGQNSRTRNGNGVQSATTSDSLSSASHRPITRLRPNSAMSESLVSELPQKSPQRFLSKRLPSPPIEQPDDHESPNSDSVITKKTTHEAHISTKAHTLKPRFLPHDTIQNTSVEAEKRVSGMPSKSKPRIARPTPQVSQAQLPSSPQHASKSKNLEGVASVPTKIEDSLRTTASSTKPSVLCSSVEVNGIGGSFSTLVSTPSDFQTTSEDPIPPSAPVQNPNMDEPHGATSLKNEANRKSGTEFKERFGSFPAPYSTRGSLLATFFGTPPTPLMIPGPSDGRVSYLPFQQEKVSYYEHKQVENEDSNATFGGKALEKNSKSKDRDKNEGQSGAKERKERRKSSHAKTEADSLSSGAKSSKVKHKRKTQLPPPPIEEPDNSLKEGSEKDVHDGREQSSSAGQEASGKRPFIAEKLARSSQMKDVESATTCAKSGKKARAKSVGAILNTHSSAGNDQKLTRASKRLSEAQHAGTNFNSQLREPFGGARFPDPRNGSKSKYSPLAAFLGFPSSTGEATELASNAASCKSSNSCDFSPKSAQEEAENSKGGFAPKSRSPFWPFPPSTLLPISEIDCISPTDIRAAGITEKAAGIVSENIASQSSDTQSKISLQRFHFPSPNPGFGEKSSRTRVSLQENREKDLDSSDKLPEDRNAPKIQDFHMSAGRNCSIGDPRCSHGPKLPPDSQVKTNFTTSSADASPAQTDPKTSAVDTLPAARKSVYVQQCPEIRAIDQNEKLNYLNCHLDRSLRKVSLESCPSTISSSLISNNRSPESPLTPLEVDASAVKMASHCRSSSSTSAKKHVMNSGQDEALLADGFTIGEIPMNIKPESPNGPSVPDLSMLRYSHEEETQGDKIIDEIDRVLADIGEQFPPKSSYTEAEGAFKDVIERRSVVKSPLAEGETEPQNGKSSACYQPVRDRSSLPGSAESRKLTDIEPENEGILELPALQNSPTNLYLIDESIVDSPLEDKCGPHDLASSLEESSKTVWPRVPNRQLSNFFMHALQNSPPSSVPDEHFEGLLSNPLGLVCSSRGAPPSEIKSEENCSGLENHTAWSSAPGLRIIISQAKKNAKFVEVDDPKTSASCQVEGPPNTFQGDQISKSSESGNHESSAPFQAEEKTLANRNDHIVNKKGADSVDQEKAHLEVLAEVSKESTRLSNRGPPSTVGASISEAAATDVICPVIQEPESRERPGPLVATREQKQLLEAMKKKSRRPKPSRRATAPGELMDNFTACEEPMPTKLDTTRDELKVAKEPPRKIPKPKFEQALLRYSRSILSRIISHMDYLDFYTLPQISRKLRYGLNEGEAREVILERFLGDVGYRGEPSLEDLDPTRLTSHGRCRSGPTISRSSNRQTVGTANPSNHGPPRPSRSSTSCMGSTANILHSLPITLKDLHAYYTGLEFGPEELPELAERLKSPQGLDLPTFRMIRASTRAYNKLLMRIRSQPDFTLQPEQESRSNNFHLGKRLLPIYAPGKPAVMKVWVPTRDNEMSHEELVECERELWKSEVRPFMRKGDVCWNTAMGSNENQGRVLFDGRCLQDLEVTWDPLGHLPSWLNMFMFPPSFYHHVVTSSTTTPVFFLDLTDFKTQIQETMNLCQDKFNVPSLQPQFTRRTSVYRVQRWVYRAVINIPSATKTGTVEGMQEWDTADPGVGVIHRDWVGKIVIEVDGTAEKARDLIHRSTKASVENFISPDQISTYRFASREKQQALRMKLRRAQLSPWKIIRERSRPGHLWIQ